jgi:geranylgeranyl pyrophosphate synthase
VEETAGIGGVPVDPMEEFRARFLPRYAAAIDGCEQRLKGIAARPGGLLGEACSSTLAAGGKRLRPLLVFLAGSDGSGSAEALLAAGAAVELVHMATLVHDDVLDKAELRRGQPTLAAKYGSGVSTAAGDYLFSSAFAELASTGSAPAAAELARTSIGLSRGELAQMEQAYDYDLTRVQYIDRCQLKTSGLFVTACRLGAMLSGAPDATIEALGEYGSCLGLAFQITDDILDFQGDAASFGKQIGTDLRDGTVTLPLIMAIEADRSLTGELAGELSEARVEEVCKQVRASGALEQSAHVAQDFVARAQDALEAVDGPLEVEPLALIAAMAANRNV